MEKFMRSQSEDSLSRSSDHIDPPNDVTIEPRMMPNEIEFPHSSSAYIYCPPY